MDDSPPIRPSVEEREAAKHSLRSAVVEGRITLDEFGDRFAEVLSTSSRAVLARLTADLPSNSPVSSTRSGRAREWILGIFGGDDRAGRWRLAEATRVINVFGGADLDLGSAVISAPVSKMTVISIFGGSTIKVPDGLDVETSGCALFGGNEVALNGSRTPDGAPVLHIKMFSLFGGNDVKQA